MGTNFKSSEDQSIQLVKNMAYLNNSQTILKGTKIYLSHSNLLKSYQQMQISQGPGVQSEKNIDYGHHSMIQKSGLVLNPAIIQSSANPSSAVASKKQVRFMKVQPFIDRVPNRYIEDEESEIQMISSQKKQSSQGVCELKSVSKSSGEKPTSSNYV